jgi:4-amino-4-deoxy-L-arabinose transferase-like glycosyltransferase
MIQGIEKPGPDLLASTDEWLKPAALLSLLTVIVLLPFIHKAFHIDDPLFVWAAHYIREHPLDFYRFDVNWYGFTARAADVIKNPPITSYYIALAGSIIGWSEARLHLVFIAPAVAAIVGTYLLARSRCSRPMLAALLVLFSPAFLVSSTTVMCDTMMLAFWIWTLVVWDLALQKNSLAFFFAAGFLAAACCLTKYFGVCLLPLLTVDAVVKERRAGRWLTAIILPVILIGLYEWYTARLYGYGLFFNAAGYAAHLGSARSGNAVTVGLAFLGGCVITLAFYSHLLWSRRTLLAGLAVSLVLALVLIGSSKMAFRSVILPSSVYYAAPQMAVMVVLGFFVLFLGAGLLWRERSRVSLQLFLWLIGTSFFAAFLNWTVNARSILPLMPAVAILIARSLDAKLGPGKGQFDWKTGWPLLPVAVVSLLVSAADYWSANSARSAAEAVHERTKTEQGALWFEGHWGFQYYMERFNGKPLDAMNSVLYRGDLIVMPMNSSNVTFFPSGTTLKVRLESASRNIVSTMDSSLGAGFYASDIGPLPFVFGKPRPDRYDLLTIDRNIRFAPSKTDRK